jgi:two pore calcium channel protein 1
MTLYNSSSPVKDKFTTLVDSDKNEKSIELVIKCAFQLYNDIKERHSKDCNEKEVEKEWDKEFSKVATEQNILDSFSRLQTNEHYDHFNSVNAAAVFIASALNSRDIFQNLDSMALKLYWIYYNWFVTKLYLLIIVSLLVLGIFEKPAVVTIPYGITKSLELFFMALILIRSLVYFRVFGWRKFFTNGWKMLKMAIIMLTIAEIICSIFLPDMIRITLILRPFFLAEHLHTVRSRINLILKTLYRLVEFLILMLANVVFYSLITYSLFSSNPKDPYFNSLFNSFLNIFVLQTTANYPDVTIPAVSKSPASALLFVFFLLVQLYFVYNLNIALVYNNYKNELEKMKVQYFVKKRVSLLIAFRLVDRNCKDYMELEEWQILYKKCRPFSTKKKAISKFRKEDRFETGKLNLCQFFHLCDNIMKDDYRLPLEWLPDLLKKVRYSPLLKITEHKIFKLIIILFIFANCVQIVLELALETNEKLRYFFIAFELSIVVFFTIELLLKLIAEGPLDFTLRKWNWFELSLIIISIASIVISFMGIEHPRQRLFMATLRLLRLLRFIQYFGFSDQLKLVLDTFIQVLPTASTQIITILLWYYAYGVIGMYVFGGKFVRTNPALIGTDYDKLNFYDVSNFNNLLYAFLALFQLTVINNWQVTMWAAIAITNRWACLYFLVFWMFTSIIFMNLIVATVLDVFTNQFNQKQDLLKQKGSKENKDIENESERIGLVDYPVSTSSDLVCIDPNGQDNLTTDYKQFP